MKILFEGKAHKHIAYFTECEYCGSELRILKGDPMSSKEECHNCDRRQYWIRYVCPICRSKCIAMTGSSFGAPTGNCERKEIILDKEDREELREFDSLYQQNLLTEEEKEWVNNRIAP